MLAEDGDVKEMDTLDDPCVRSSKVKKQKNRREEDALTWVGSG